MVAHLLVVVVVAQAATPSPRLELEQSLVQLEAQSRRSHIIQILGGVTLLATGLVGATRNVFTAIQRWYEYQSLLHLPEGDRGVKEMEGAIVVSWIVTGALTGMTAILFGIGFWANPADELGRVRADLKSTP